MGMEQELNKRWEWEWECEKPFRTSLVGKIIALQKLCKIRGNLGYLGLRPRRFVRPLLFKVLDPTLPPIDML